MPQIVIQFDEPEKQEYLNQFISDIRMAIHYSKWKPENCKVTEEVI